jgi:hypothetical protein
LRTRLSFDVSFILHKRAIVRMCFRAYAQKLHAFIRKLKIKAAKKAEGFLVETNREKYNTGFPHELCKNGGDEFQLLL